MFYADITMVGKSGRPELSIALVDHDRVVLNTEK
jgi:hypothetical protein